jgi:hypothetical protein
MDEHNVPPVGTESQDSLETFISDLSSLRRNLLATEKRRRSGVLAGQLLILARSYQSGKRPSRRTLKRFFYFVAREAA